MLEDYIKNKHQFYHYLSRHFPLTEYKYIEGCYLVHIMLTQSGYNINVYEESCRRNIIFIDYVILNSKMLECFRKQNKYLEIYLNQNARCDENTMLKVIKALENIEIYDS